MSEKPLEIKQAIQIQKPANEVFDAIIDPAKMSQYFIAQSSGKMEEGAEVMWKFPEFDESFPVLIHKAEKDKYISFYWDLDKDDKLLVEIALASADNNSTIVTVTESGKKNDEEGLKWLAGNSGGWANFLACMKAYLEYGINLRKGAFDFISK